MKVDEGAPYIQCLDGKNYSVEHVIEVQFKVYHIRKKHWLCMTE